MSVNASFRKLQMFNLQYHGEIQLLHLIPLATPVDACLKNSFIQPHDLWIVL